MTAIAYGTRAYRRDNGNLPELKLKNMFLEATTTTDDGVALLSRQGLSLFSSPGVGPVTGMFSHENVFAGDVFSVSGGTLYRGTTSIGVVSGTGPVSFASGMSNELAVCAGSNIHVYNGTTLSTVAFPGSQSVSWISFHDGLYFAAVLNSDKWYWSSVLDADTWDALDFATAESGPDTLKEIRPINDSLYMFGADNIERWANTGDPNLPYTRVEGAIIQKGVFETGCVAELDNLFLFVGNDGIVYRLAESLERISDNGIEERIAASVFVRAFSFIHEGHSFFCIRLDNYSFLYDTTTSQWCEFTTYDKTNWSARCACQNGTRVLLGDDTSGIVWQFSGWLDGTAPLERLFTAAFPLDGNVMVVDNLTIKVNTGWTSLLAGQGSDPVVEMRRSIDAGATWGSWRTASLGEQGKYRIKTQWRRCGMFDFPGGMFEIRTTDPIPFRVSSVVINEKNGGRSR
jgi:hypothetical protein